MHPNNRKPDPPRLKVINLWAGPGAGKSTTAAGLFNLMKVQGYKVELVVEWAKEAVYEKRTHTLASNQLYVFAKQEQRLQRLLGNVHFAITDSPLPLSLIYAPRSGAYREAYFKDCVLGFWRSYENINFHVARTKAYEKYGRQQTEQEARKIDSQVEYLLDQIAPNHFSVKGNSDAPRRILDVLQRDFMLIP